MLGQNRRDDRHTTLGPSGRPVHGATQPGSATPCARTSALSASEVDQVVDLIAAGRRTRRSIALPAELQTRDWDSVMAVLLGVESRLPGTRAGWKVGAASEQVRRVEGIPTPTPGRIYAEAVVASPARLPAELFINYRNCECEFAFRLGADFPARRRPYSEADVRAGIEYMVPVIEIGDMVFDDWYAASSYYGPCLDNGGGAAIVYGSEIRDWADHDLAAATIDVIFNGTYLKSGTGRAAMEHPVRSLEWMINWLRERGRAVRAGELVSTGTCTGHCFASEGDTVAADFGPFGMVEVTFEPAPSSRPNQP